MKRKLTALLIALCSIVSFSALPAYAELFVTPSGGMLEVYKIHINAVVVETDGTALTEEMVKDVDGYTALETYEEFLENYTWGIDVTNIPPDSTAYVIHTENRDNDALMAIGRKLMFEMDCITDAYLVEAEESQSTSLDTSIDVTLSSADINLNSENISELAGFTIYQREESNTAALEFPATLNAWFTEQKMTKYEKYVYLNEFGDALVEKYPDIFVDARYTYWILDSGGMPEYYAFSIWQTAGDSNADGTVTAEDAADLLITAAAAGSGAEITATAAADVNADGTVSADDAAAVLVYAAAQGSGSPMSWVEVLRK